LLISTDARITLGQQQTHVGFRLLSSAFSVARSALKLLTNRLSLSLSPFFRSSSICLCSTAKVCCRTPARCWATALDHAGLGERGLECRQLRLLLLDQLLVVIAFILFLLQFSDAGFKLLALHLGLGLDAFLLDLGPGVEDGLRLLAARSSCRLERRSIPIRPESSFWSSRALRILPFLEVLDDWIEERG